MSEVLQSLQRRYPKGLPFHAYLTPLAETFASSGCADDNFLQEFIFGDEGKFWSRAWEAILFGRFEALGWTMTPAAAGPDFLIATPIGDVLVEATVPSPSGIPPEWLDDHNGVYHMPHEQMLLRWTSALSDKRDKHQRDIAGGRVSATTPFVIAINSCRLSRSPEENGISQWPFAVETVFPIGPWAVPYDHRTGAFGETYQSLRFTIKKRTGATSVPVSTDNFMTPDYACVSALIGCAACFAEDVILQKFGGAPPMFLVPNPLATNPLPPGWLPNAIEFSAQQIGPDEFTVSRVTPRD